MLERDSKHVCVEVWLVHHYMDRKTYLPDQSAIPRKTGPFLQVFAQQRHYLHRLLAYEDELAAVIAWILDRQSLGNGSASFSDGLYGLRRAMYGADKGKPDMLSRAQQRLALLHLVSLSTHVVSASDWYCAALTLLWESHDCEFRWYDCISMVKAAMMQA